MINHGMSRARVTSTVGNLIFAGWLPHFTTIRQGAAPNCNRTYSQCGCVHKNVGGSPTGPESPARHCGWIYPCTTLGAGSNSSLRSLLLRLGLDIAGDCPHKTEKLPCDRADRYAVCFSTPDEMPVLTVQPFLSLQSNG